MSDVSNVSTGIDLSKPVEDVSADYAPVKIIERDNMQMVSARDLYEGLGVRSHFTEWFEARVKENKLIEGEDFFPVPGESTGGRPEKDYSIPIAWALMLAGQSKNENGPRLKRYFVKAIEAWNTPEMVLQRAAQLTSYPGIAKYKTAETAFKESVEALQAVIESKPHAKREEQLVNALRYVKSTRLFFSRMTRDVIIHSEKATLASGALQKLFRLSDYIVQSITRVAKKEGFDELNRKFGYLLNRYKGDNNLLNGNKENSNLLEFKPPASRGQPSGYIDDDDEDSEPLVL